MFGLNKPRTHFGKWIDKKGLSQLDIVQMTGVSRNTISSICNDPDYDPYNETKIKIISALRRKGYDVYAEDFWDLL